MCQGGLVFPVFEKSSEGVDDSIDPRKDVGVSFRKESISLAPFDLGTVGQDMGSLYDDTDVGNPRWGVPLWSFVRFSRGTV